MVENFKAILRENVVCYLYYTITTECSIDERIENVVNYNGIIKNLLIEANLSQSNFLDQLQNLTNFVITNPSITEGHEFEVLHGGFAFDILKFITQPE